MGMKSNKRKETGEMELTLETAKKKKKRDENSLRNIVEKLELIRKIFFKDQEENNVLKTKTVKYRGNQ